jgi:hypothetical protein
MTAAVEQVRPALARGSMISMPRNEWFAAIFIVACINGLGSQVIETVHLFGWADAALSTFGTSAIVWIACYAGIRLVAEPGSDKVRAGDVLSGLVLLVPIALPTGGLSWFAVSALGLYVILCSAPSSALRRGAIILFAAAVPMVWTRLLFRYFGDIIVTVDAWFVGILLGTGSKGNVVPLLDGSGSLIILPYCSSLANVSLAFLSWALISQWEPHRRSIQDLYVCLVAAMSVILVNVARIGLMAISERYYNAIHSQIGEVITNLLILGLTLTICLLGVRRENVVRV